MKSAPFFVSRRDGRAPPAAGIVRKAIRGRIVLEIDYGDSSGARSTRPVRPLALWAFTEGWLFAAWRQLRNDFRAFRLDRLAGIRETGERFDEEPGRDLKAYIAARRAGRRAPAGRSGPETG